MSDFRNPDGKTYNGVKLLSAATGIPEDEMKWMADRIKELLGQGVPRAEALRMVREESVRQPWKKAKT